MRVTDPHDVIKVSLASPKAFSLDTYQERSLDFQNNDLLRYLPD